MKISYFRYKCEQCGHHFYAPALSDFTYGEFIFTSKNGNHYAYLNVFEDIAFKEIKKIAEEKFQFLKKDEKDAIIWIIYTQICDCAPDGERYELGASRCPNCKRTKFLTLEDDIRQDPKDVPNIAHIEWDALSLIEKYNRILHVVRESGIA